MVSTFSKRFIAVFTVVAAVFLGFLGGPDEDTERPLRFSVAESFVQVTIINPNGFSATLYRVEKTESSWVAELDPTAEQTLELSSGIYQLKFGDHRQYGVAVPALAENACRLEIELVEPPTERDGWCWIPDGPTIFGDTLGIGAEDERPLKIVNVSGFWLGEKEVTNKQYAEFLSEQKVFDPAWIDLGSRKCRIQKLNGSYQSDAPELPVVMVSLRGAKEYCRWQSERLGEVCRLPTEREWEKAARGPESYVYSYGNIYTQSRANQESGTLKEVGLDPPNGFGLYDMTGNAFEWMSDLYDPAKPDAIMNQSLRGGSYVLDGMYQRNSFRMRQSPRVMTDDIGFRVLNDPTKGT